MILGASGQAGGALAVLLAPGLAPDLELVLVGRDPGRLAAARDRVDAAAGRAVAAVARHDLTDQDETRRAVAGARLVVVAASLPEQTGALARATLAAGADWFDLMLSSRRKLDALAALAPEIHARGCCFVTDGGFHPGLPAAMARWAATRLGRLRRADIHAGMRIDWRAERLADSTLAEAVEEFARCDLTARVGGRLRRLRLRDLPVIDFAPPIGRRACTPMPLDEMRALVAAMPGLETAGFYVGGFNPFTDGVAFPLLMALARIPALRRQTIALTRLVLARCAGAPPPHWLELRLIAEGEGGTAAMTVGGDDPYRMTAAPAVACLRRLLDGTLRRPGLIHQGMLVDPAVFFDDLAGLGLTVGRSGGAPA
ncbi:hypothetical protein [Phaeospirillum tilakii]|uniref:Saccharopine dehydrogenase NADP binding domain-containing protein n=1 Tax=Phaeospirillum tilakii TaxID=741673 RepID=A0ABW5C8B4_9PROT